MSRSPGTEDGLEAADKLVFRGLDGSPGSPKRRRAASRSPIDHRLEKPANERQRRGTIPPPIALVSPTSRWLAQ
jgi:hypothetical protein